MDVLTTTWISVKDGFDPPRFEDTNVSIDLLVFHDDSDEATIGWYDFTEKKWYNRLEYYIDPIEREEVYCYINVTSWSLIPKKNYNGTI